MDWLVNNPIASMHGPQFLVFYALVIAGTLIYCRLAVRQADTTGSLPVPEVPTRPDPGQLAYLRGGENELARLTVLDLIGRGYLCATDDNKQIEQAPSHPDPRHLSATERGVFEWFSQPRSARDMFAGGMAPDLIRAESTRYQQRLSEEQLLTPAETREAAWRIGRRGAALILGLGGYKLLVALAAGRTNVGFLIILGLGALLLLVRLSRPDRLSSRGRAYLRRLQLAFESLRGQSTLTAADPSLLLLVGLFGVGALTGTPYDQYQQMFRKSATSGGSCGGGCGSCGGGGGGGDGGGCGGGCGGCGGGD